MSPRNVVKRFLLQILCKFSYLCIILRKCQLLGTLPPNLHRGSASGTHWGTYVFRTPSLPTPGKKMWAPMDDNGDGVLMQHVSAMWLGRRTFSVTGTVDSVPAGRTSLVGAATDATRTSTTSPQDVSVCVMLPSFSHTRRNQYRPTCIVQTLCIFSF